MIVMMETTQNYLVVNGQSLSQGEAVISYLPYPHLFEQAMLAICLMYGLRKGYYTGDPTKIAEDCSVLRPVIFPSVPRLYNKIYSKIKSTFTQATGCKSWLINKAVDAKLANLQ